MMKSMVGYRKKRRRRSELTSVSKEVSAVLRHIGRDQRGVHPEIWARWSDIVGNDLGKRTFPRSLYYGTLLIAVSSSAWMNELTYLKTTIMDKLVEEVGPDVVTDIKLVLDTTLFTRKSVPPQAPRAPLTDINALPEDVRAAVSRIEDKNLRDTVLRAARATIKK